VGFLTLSHAVGFLTLGTKNAFDDQHTKKHTITNIILNYVPGVNWSYCTRLWPMIAVNVIGLASNTLCLKYIDASLYQVCADLIVINS
jgi:hypothetical protein